MSKIEKYLNSQKYKRKFEFLVKHEMRTLNYQTNLSFVPNGSYTTLKDNKVIMNIDVTQFNLDKFLNVFDINMLTSYLCYHEMGHIWFTDFNVVIQNAKMIEEKQKYITSISKSVKETAKKNNDNYSSNDIQLIKDAIKDYVYWLNNKNMLNSIEDGAIEHLVFQYRPDIYGDMVFGRDEITKQDRDSLDRKYNKLNQSQIPENSPYLLDSLMSEIRMMATIAYRKELKYPLLEKFFNQDEIAEMEQLGIYARLCSKDTSERNAISQVFMDKLDKFISAKVEEIANEYIDKLKNSIDESKAMENLLNSIANSSSFGSSETSISAPMPNVSGNIPQITPPPSKYKLDLPDDVLNQINKKQQTSQSQGSGNKDNKDNGNNKNTSGDNETSDGSRENQNSCDSQNNQGSTIDKKEKRDAEDGGVHGFSEDSNSISASEVQPYNMIDEKSTADKALKERRKAAQKSARKIQDNLNKQEILSGNTLHMGSMNYRPYSTSSINTDILKHVKSDTTKHINIFVKEMKKIIMKNAKNECLKGRDNGNLNMNGLYRVATDGRVFQKTTEGKEKRIRFCVLVDNSGSMSGSRIYYAMQGCYMIAKTAQRLKIPYAVYGHESLHLTKYIDYKDSKSPKAPEQIFKMRSGGGTWDGFAMQRPLQELVKNKRKDEELVFIIISDGETGQESIIKETIDKYLKLFNVKTIGIGIGDALRDVQRIYENNVTVPNIRMLPNEMVNILKSLIK